MLAVAEWSLGYALELGSGDLPTKVFWAKVEYLGIVTVPVMWLLFSLQYTGRKKWLTRRNLALLAIEPAVMLLLVWSNDFHGLIWSNIKLNTIGPLSILDFTYGVWFWVNTAYSYLLLLIGTILLFQAFWSAPRLYRGQAGALLIGALTPWVGNALYISGLSPFPHLDLTPIAFTFTGLAVAWGLFRFRLLDVVPVARNAVIESMSDGVIVLDAQNRIVDLNPAAQRAIGRMASEAIGQPAAQVFSGCSCLVERYRDVIEAHDEIALGEKDEEQRYFDLRISPLHDRSGCLTGRLVVFHDITERKQAESEILERQERLKAINDIAIETAGTFDLKQLLQNIIDRASELVKAEMGVIHLVDTDTGAVRDTFSSNYPIESDAFWRDRATPLQAMKPDAQDKIPPGVKVQGQGVLARIAAGEVILTEDITQESGYIGCPSWHPQIRACIGIPVRFAGKLQALLLLGHTDERFSFSDDDRELAQTLVNLAAVAIHTAKQFGELENLTSFQRKILDTAATAVFTVDVEQRITSVNSEFCEITGFAEEEVLGQHCDVLHGNPCMKRCGLYDQERKESIYHRQCEVTSKGGRQLTILKNANLLYDEQGNVTGGIESFVDVTELIEAREAAEAANRAKSEFLANMSHEIRTPMNGIIGMTELALDTELASEPREYLEMVMKSADNLLTLINDILDFSKIEAGKLDLESSDFNLRSSLGDMVKVLALRADAEGLELACHIPPDVPDALVGDVGRLRQIIINLVGNAIKFTEQGEVVVSVETESQTEKDERKEGTRKNKCEGGEMRNEEGRMKNEESLDYSSFFNSHSSFSSPTQHKEVCLHFAVTDTGIGIPKEKQQAIFRAFEQVDGSMTRKYEGTGLGLAISSQLVELMGGRIWLESNVGKGSTFHFTVRLGLQEEPAFVSAAKDEDKSPPDAHYLTSESQVELPVGLPPQQQRILLAEDNPINQMLAVGILEKRGYMVSAVSNGREALDFLDKKPFDLVLMDVQMPEMGGFEATAAIREREKETGLHIPIIAMTAHAMKGDRERCLEAGMDGYIPKPIRAKELFETIENLLPRKGNATAEVETGAP